MTDKMHGYLYQNALLSLSSGYLDPLSKDILSYSPLPDDITDSYTSREISCVRESMMMTANAMTVWIEEAKKANYFSEHFVKLSRMIMNGVTVMGRGLVSLHNRGEDPDSAPMSAGDLIGVASYHLRKSYLGVLQTAKTHPEISERLLMNQLSWNKTLMRLFRTREKLNSPSAVRKGVVPADDFGPAGNEKQTDTCHLSAGTEKQAFNDIAALFEPAAFRAPGAFKALDSTVVQKRKDIPVSHYSAGSDSPEKRTREVLPKPVDRESVNTLRNDSINPVTDGNEEAYSEKQVKKTNEPDPEKESRKKSITEKTGHAEKKKRTVSQSGGSNVPTPERNTDPADTGSRWKEWFAERFQDRGKPFQRHCPSSGSVRSDLPDPDAMPDHEMETRFPGALRECRETDHIRSIMDEDRYAMEACRKRIFGENYRMQKLMFGDGLPEWVPPACRMT